MGKRVLKPLILAFGIIFVAGCASITKGKYQEITVESNVSGALVELDGVELGYTPFKGKIKRGKEGRIKVNKPGYFTGYVEVTQKRNDEAFTSGNMGLGFAYGSPYFLFGLDENFVQYPKRRREYEKAREEYEKRKNNGEDMCSEAVPQKPQNNAPLLFFTGTVGAIGAYGVFASVDMSTNAAWEYSPSSYYVQLKEEGQSHSDYSDELFIRYFATMNHSQIAIDAGNNGEYAEALADIMETKMDGEAARQGINEALEKSKGDQVMFGDALMERFRRR
ncbi:MAG: PEGA domain-containing protein [Fibromonadaceae bacterium]|jgi:hypothetical protein|nr:PEGA domain-containing protein [Fibromonadaceae bacterium]